MASAARQARKRTHTGPWLLLRLQGGFRLAHAEGEQLIKAASAACEASRMRLLCCWRLAAVGEEDLTEVPD
jgi:hypothetical protein